MEFFLHFQVFIKATWFQYKLFFKKSRKKSKPFAYNFFVWPIHIWMEGSKGKLLRKNERKIRFLLFWKNIFSPPEIFYAFLTKFTRLRRIYSCLLVGRWRKGRGREREKVADTNAGGVWMNYRERKREKVFPGLRSTQIPFHFSIKFNFKTLAHHVTSSFLIYTCIRRTCPLPCSVLPRFFNGMSEKCVFCQCLFFSNKFLNYYFCII